MGFPCFQALPVPGTCTLPGLKVRPHWMTDLTTVGLIFMSCTGQSISIVIHSLVTHTAASDGSFYICCFNTGVCSSGESRTPVAIIIQIMECSGGQMVRAHATLLRGWIAAVDYCCFVTVDYQIKGQNAKRKTHKYNRIPYWIKLLKYT